MSGQTKRIADYLVALFENRPTGIFLTLQVQGALRFDSRTLKGVAADPSNAQELLLDGQQRLTSLWSALKGKAAYDFYVKVTDLQGRDMSVEMVDFRSPNSVKGREARDPKTAYESNLRPHRHSLGGLRNRHEWLRAGSR